MADKTTPAAASGNSRDEYEEITVKVRKDLDPELRARALATLGPRESVVIGNLADVQRAGADAAASGEAGGGSAINLHPSAEDAELVTPAEFEAHRGRLTVETERTGTSPEMPEPQTVDTTAAVDRDESKGSAKKDGSDK